MNISNKKCSYIYYIFVCYQTGCISDIFPMYLFCKLFLCSFNLFKLHCFIVGIGQYLPSNYGWFKTKFPFENEMNAFLGGGKATKRGGGSRATGARGGRAAGAGGEREGSKENEKESCSKGQKTGRSGKFIFFNQLALREIRKNLFSRHGDVDLCSRCDGT